MTTVTLPIAATYGRRFLTVAASVLAVLLAEIKVKTTPTVAHLREHAYGIAGLGCIDAAAFVHSTFTGLLVTGVSFLIFEWKVNQA